MQAGAAAAMLVFLGGLLWGEHQRNRWMITICKPLASASFIAVALASGALTGPAWAHWLLGGLVLSWFGDVFLIAKAQAWFTAGLASFLLGHLAYAVAFVTQGVDTALMAGAAVLLLVPAAAVLRWLWQKLPGGMRGPVAAYVAVITVMLAAAVAAFAYGGNMLVVAGAALFYLSDLSVARDRFVKEVFVNRAWGLPAYYLGQLALALSSAGSPR